MKIPKCTLLLFLLICNNIWAQQQGKVEPIVFEKRRWKVMRVVPPPGYTNNEETFIWLDPIQITHDKKQLTELVGTFLKRNQKYFHIDKITSVGMDCFFDRKTFELEEVIYYLHKDSMTNYSIFKNLTEEPKARSGLSSKEKFRKPLPFFNRKYYHLYAPLLRSDLEPYLKKGRIKN